jgi:hypothetical protein
MTYLEKLFESNAEDIAKGKKAITIKKCYRAIESMKGSLEEKIIDNCDEQDKLLLSFAKGNCDCLTTIINKRMQRNALNDMILEVEELEKSLKSQCRDIQDTGKE